VEGKLLRPFDVHFPMSMVCSFTPEFTLSIIHSEPEKDIELFSIQVASRPYPAASFQLRIIHIKQS
jgi:hypothetical protein